MKVVSPRLVPPAAAFWVAAVLCALMAGPSAKAQTSGALLNLLQLGGSGAGGLFPDGFFTKFDDGSGWWHRTECVATTQLNLTNEYDDPIASRLTDGYSRIHDWQARFALSVPWRTRGMNGVVALGLMTSNNRVYFAGRDGSTSVHGQGTLTDFYLRLMDPVPGLVLQAGLPVWSDGSRISSRVKGIGFRYAPCHGIVLQASRTASQHTHAVQAMILADPVDFGLNLDHRAWRLAAGLNPWRRVRCELAWHDLNFGAVNQRTTAQVYEFIPESGFARGWSNLGTLQLGKGHQAAFRYTDESIEANASATWGGQKFGSLDAFRVNAHSLLLGWRWQTPGSSKWQAETESVHFDAYAHATIKTWPFTSAVISLLGVTEILKGSVDAHWRRSTLSWSPSLKHHSLRLGVSWFDIHPAGQLLIRQSVFVFGQGERHLENLAVHRIRLASILLDLAIPVGRQDLTLALQQFVWAKLDSYHDATPDGGGEEVEKPSPSGWWGGTYLLVGWRWLLG